MQENRKFDLIIVGLGPVGAVVANLLAQFNISILVIEKNEYIHPTPRAIHFDGEIMRIFQNIGLFLAFGISFQPTVLRWFIVLRTKDTSHQEH